MLKSNNKPLRIITAFTIVLLSALIISYSLDALIKTTKFQLLGSLINHVDTKENVVALTYDDGPNPPYTNQLLNILERYQIKATFFVIGKNIEKYPETIRLIMSKGHELGNHSYSHERMVFKQPSFVKLEIEKTDRLLRQLGVKQEIHFRAPFGRKFIVLPYMLAKMHKKNILWNVNSKDYAAVNSDAIEKYVLERVRPGSIILLHDGGGKRSRTVAATETIIKKLQKKGYEFKTVSELIRKI